MMAKSKSYKTGESLRTALSDRLKVEAKKQDVELNRLTRQVAYDRLLARIFSETDAPFLLKGGYAMQLRVARARGTKDIDLALRDAKLLSSESKEQNEAIFEYLEKVSTKDLGDFFSFVISAPIKDLEAAPYGGARFHVEAKIDGRTFEKFLLDVGVGDVWIEPVTTLKSVEWLDFAGIPAGAYPAISNEQQFAEKLHAYTLPRPDGRENTRVKDLVDLVLFVDQTEVNADALRKSIEATFKRRGTHAFSKSLPTPPSSWERPFSALAKECGLSADLQKAFATVQKFLDSVFQ